LFPPDSFAEDLRAEHHGEELLFVLDGPIEVRFADRIIRLDIGDAVQFRAACCIRCAASGRRAVSSLP
jgi:uncharacterized cupin superfamily protein